MSALEDKNGNKMWYEACTHKFSKFYSFWKCFVNFFEPQYIDKGEGVCHRLKKNTDALKVKKCSIGIIVFEISRATFIDFLFICLFIWLVSQAKELQLLKRNNRKLPARGKKLFITPVWQMFWWFLLIDSFLVLSTWNKLGNL